MRWPDLPAHSALIERLLEEVEAGEAWRWLDLCCSLASGRGDELSDIDVGVGHRVDAEELGARGIELVEAVGANHGVLVHAEDRWPSGVLRFAVEYRSGVQLDLVAMPAEHRPGLPDASIALVDKDGDLGESWTPPVATATATQAREWIMLGWWAVSNIAKYLRRGSLFEAVEALRDARTQCLRLHAVGQGIPYPAFGLTSLLDYEPYEVPDQLAAAHAIPESPADVLKAAWAVVGLLDSSAEHAAAALDTDLSTPWAAVARVRLEAATATGRS